MKKLENPIKNHKGTYVIAEIGSNHGGRFEAAINHIEEAAKTGASAVKFQLFKLEDILNNANKGDRDWELPKAWIPDLAECAENAGVDFICTPFAPWAVEILNGYVKVWKIGSYEYKRADIWDAVIKTGKPIIWSDGRGVTPFEPRGRVAYRLQCVSKYPATPSNYDMGLLSRECDGISDHTLSTLLPGVAVSHGAYIVEKHFCLSRWYGGVDIPHSIEPLEFREMMTYIKLGEEILAGRNQQPVQPGLAGNRRE